MTKGEAIRIVEKWLGEQPDTTRIDIPALNAIKRLLQEVKKSDGRAG